MARRPSDRQRRRLASSLASAAAGRSRHPNAANLLTLEECRRTLGHIAASDTDLAALRDTLYGVAEAIVDSPARHAACTATSAAGQRTTNRILPVGRFGEALKLIPKEHRPEVEERAAIAHFDGGLMVEEAEQTAIANYVSSCQHEESGDGAAEDKAESGE